VNRVSAKISLLANRFDALTLRERLMILVLLLAVMVGGWLNLLWDKESLMQSRIKSDVDQLSEQNDLLNEKLNGLVRQAERDPNVEIRKELEQVKKVIEEMEGRIKGTAEALIEPQEMAKLLERMLLSSDNLKLVRLSTMNTEALGAAKKKDDKAALEIDESAAKAAERNIFRHGFIVEFEGDYLSVLRYLQALEALPWQFFWDGIELGVTEYPVTRVKLQLHTLSLSEGWIGV
jgi:MSHA biogenesis protein MshJ